METTEPEVPPFAFGADGSMHLALVILAYPTDPDRVGEIAFVPRGETIVLGRERASLPDLDLAFARQRPGAFTPGPPLVARTLSRRHAVFRATAQAIAVENLGKSALIVDGIERRGSIELRPGQTLAVGRTLLLACTRRSERLPPMRGVDVPSRFGDADALGFAGESEAAWQLRARLAAVAATSDHVLLVGKDGSGRGLAAKMVHARSTRGEREPIIVNAAALDPARAAERIFGQDGSGGALATAEGSTFVIERVHRLPSHVHASLADMLESETLRGTRLVMTVDEGFDLASSPLLRSVATRVHVPSRESRTEDAWCWLLATGVNPTLYDVEATESFVADVRERGFAALTAIARAEEPTNEAPVPALPPTLEFEVHLEAIREALRSFHDAGRLAKSRLVATKAVRAREPSSDARLVVAALRAVLAAAIDRLDLVRDRDLLRETYLVADAKQLAIAERFHMPYSTYRRHLARAAERLAERLWQHERGFR